MQTKVAETSVHIFCCPNDTGDFYLMEHKFNTKEIEHALTKAIISTLYYQGLLTNEELSNIKKDLRRQGIVLDKITLKSDVYCKEVHHDE